jgi:hypothetical protein
MNILNLIGRNQLLFTQDIGSHEKELCDMVSFSRFLVIGGAGSIRHAVTKEIFKRNPLKLHVVDISENNMVELKRTLAHEYATFFAGQNNNFRSELEDTKANYWLMCLELENVEERNAFLKATNEAKTMTRPIWQLMYRLPMYQHCYRDAQKNAEYLEERIVNIPSSVRI